MHKIWVAPPLPPLFITFFCLCAPCLLLYNLLLLPILAQNALGSLRLQSLCPVFSIHCRAHLHNDAQEFEKKEMRVRARAATNLAFLNMLEAHTGQFDCTVHGLQASWPLFSVFYLLWTTREWPQAGKLSQLSIKDECRHVLRCHALRLSICGYCGIWPSELSMEHDWVAMYQRAPNKASAFTTVTTLQKWLTNTLSWHWKVTATMRALMSIKAASWQAR